VLSPGFVTGKCASAIRLRHYHPNHGGYATRSHHKDLSVNVSCIWKLLLKCWRWKR
jgi:hypothetical protein